MNTAGYLNWRDYQTWLNFTDEDYEELQEECENTDYAKYEDVWKREF